MRIVLDINILVSGIISKLGPPGQLLGMWRDRRYVLVASEPQIERMRDVLARPRLQRFVDPAEAAELVDAILDAAAIVVPDPSINLSADPEDNVILGTAVAGQADMVVTGDHKHLLRLHNVADIPILAPRDAIERITAAGQ